MVYMSESVHGYIQLIDFVCAMGLCAVGWIYEMGRTWLYTISLVCICSMGPCTVGWLYVSVGTWLVVCSIGLYCIDGI